METRPRIREKLRAGLVIWFAVVLAMSSRPSALPRIALLSDSELTEAHRALLERYRHEHSDPQGTVPNDLRVFLKHPALVHGVLPFAKYIVGESTLSARHRELVILRTAWLCRSEYQWARHAPLARKAGLSDQELRRIAVGPTDGDWDDFDATLLRMADELLVDSFVSDATWNGLAAKYNTQQLMDAVFTVAELTMLSEVVNSLHLDPDPDAADRLPASAPYRVSAPKTGRRLIGEKARIAPLDPPAWTAEVRKMLDPSASGRAVAAVYRTFAQHPRMYAPRQLLSEYIRTQATLDPRTRELLIMRIGILCHSDYEWAAHAPAGRRAGMTDADVQHVIDGPRDASDAFDDTLLRAVDELYTDRTISDRTWRHLAERLNEQQLLDVLITTGGYHMVSMALNTFGVQLEPGGERIPIMAPR